MNYVEQLTRFQGGVFPNLQPSLWSARQDSNLHESS